ncbi:MAG TPA: phage holin family protein [Blastocatellia bacterium]|nr:phage holin family protein [Blastocatellia bacterium]
MQARQDIKRMRSEAGTQDSFADLLVELAEKSATLVREEVLLARQELQENFRNVKQGVLLLSVGIGSGVFALLCFLTALILALSQYWEPWQAALVVGVVIAAVAGVIVMIGLRQIKQARLKPEQTIATLEENKEWLKEII